MSRANRAFEVSEEFGAVFGTPGDQRLFARELSAFDSPLPAALRARYIGFEPVSAPVFWIFRSRKALVQRCGSSRISIVDKGWFAPSETFSANPERACLNLELSCTIGPWRARPLWRR